MAAAEPGMFTCAKIAPDQIRYQISRPLSDIVSDPALFHTSGMIILIKRITHV